MCRSSQILTLYRGVQDHRSAREYVWMVSWLESEASARRPNMWRIESDERTLAGSTYPGRGDKKGPRHVILS